MGTPEEWTPPPARKVPTSYYRRRYGKTIRELSIQYSRSVSTVWRWLKRGWTPHVHTEDFRKPS